MMMIVVVVVMSMMMSQMIHEDEEIHHLKIISTTPTRKRCNPDKKKSQVAHMTLEMMTEGEVTMMMTIAPFLEMTIIAVTRTMIVGEAMRTSGKGRNNRLLRCSSRKGRIKDHRLRPKPQLSLPPQKPTSAGEGHRPEAVNLIVAPKMMTTMVQEPLRPLTIPQKTTIRGIISGPTTRIRWLRLPRPQSRPIRTRSRRPP